MTKIDMNVKEIGGKKMFVTNVIMSQKNPFTIDDIVNICANVDINKLTVTYVINELKSNGLISKNDYGKYILIK